MRNFKFLISFVIFFEIEPNDEHLKTAAKEAAFSFHTARHNISFRSTECTSQMIKDLFEPKYSCSRTKTAAVITNIISPLICDQVKEILSSLEYLTIITDTSNRKSNKLLPIIVRGFSETIGIVNFKLTLKSIPNETSETIAMSVYETGKN